MRTTVRTEEEGWAMLDQALGLSERNGRSFNPRQAWQFVARLQEPRVSLLLIRLGSAHPAGLKGVFTVRWGVTASTLLRVPNVRARTLRDADVT